MEDQVLQILINLAQGNANHIDIINRELGEVVATVRIMAWFLGINVVAMLGIFYKQLQTHKEIKNGNGKK